MKIQKIQEEQKMILGSSKLLDGFHGILLSLFSKEEDEQLLSFMENGEHLKSKTRRSPVFEKLIKKVWGNENAQESIKKILTILLPFLSPEKNFGTDLFNVMSPYWWTPAIEGVSIRRHPVTEKIQVFLARRGPDESSYPNELHCPGTGLRSADAYKPAPQTQFDRLNRVEGFYAKGYEFVGIKYTPEEERGPYVSLVYLVNPEGIVESGESKWYDWEIVKLDPTLVCHHRHTIIPMAIEAFLKAEKTA